jgi:hypothetical protein
MFPFLQKNKGRKVIFLLISFFFLSAYPIYKNYINGEAIATYELYRGVIEKRSKFYNPWQYRILCPLLIEGVKQVYDHTIDQIVPIEKIAHFKFRETSGFTSETEKFIHQLNNPDTLKYILIFLAFRFIEDLLILLLAYFLLRHFIKNYWLIFLGLIMISWSMGNGVSASPLNFNTYLDNILYLLTGCIILYKKNPWYILPITIIGAFNRETSLLIPFLLFVSFMNFKPNFFSKNIFKRFSWPSHKIFLITLLSFLSFVIIFIGIRIYFGYRPQGEWKVPAGLPMLKLNLISIVAVKGYFEMFGALSVLPLICLLKFRQCSHILRIWFIAIVPIWFFVHFYSVPSYESRLFFVPTFLIFIPMVLEIVQKSGNQVNRSMNKSSISTKQYKLE